MWVAAPDELIRKYKLVHADYAVESPPSCCLRVFLPSAYTNKLTIITKESTTQQITQQRKQGKLEHKNHFIKEVRYIFTVHHTYVTQAFYDLPNNTLPLDSTHPDTYNLVGFGECLHLWWIPLLNSICHARIYSLRQPLKPIPFMFPIPTQSISS